jgi:hypothetical protein
MIKYKDKTYKDTNIPLLILLLREALEQEEPDEVMKWKLKILSTLISNYSNTSNENLLKQADLVERYF